MNEDAQSLVTNVLEPGEKILWTGRPHVEPAREGRAQRAKRLRIILLGLFVLITLWILRETSGITSVGEASDALPDDPGKWFIIAVPLLLILFTRFFKLDNKSRLDRYFNSLTYAITDRRLLILEGDRITESHTPEEVDNPVVRERVPGYADVIFDTRSTRSADGGRTRDPVYRERAEVGFKALPNAMEIRNRIEEWISQQQQEAAREVTDFVQKSPAAHRHDEPTGGRRIEHSTLGFRLDAPEEWKAQVRRKKKPQGKMFLDREDWQEPGESGDWNLVRIEGPAKCKVEVEVFETASTVTFGKLANSKLADSIAGKVVDSSDDYEIDGVKGFFVTRRNDLQVDPGTGKAGIAAVVAPERHTVLYDGRRQVYIISTWPEDSEDLQRAVEAVVESIRLLP